MTPKQKQCLDFIKSYISKFGISPSLREISQNSGFKSPSASHRIVGLLIRDGYITRDSKVARGIRLVESNDNHEHWEQVGWAAQKLIASLQKENINNTGEGTVIVDAIAFGDLDIALKEAEESCHG